MNYNRVFLGGNLTREPKLSYTPSQTAVVDFGMAINKNWTDKQGNKKSKVCYVDCAAFGKTAENINKYIRKGDPLFAEGELSFSQWEAADGSKRSRLKMTVENFQFLNSKPAGEKAPPPTDEDIPF